MLTTAALIFIIISKVALGQDPRWAVETEIYPLDMAPDSVDDRYDGCTTSMNNLVEAKYLKEEISANISDFATAWKEAEHVTPRDNLDTNHLKAIFVYTGRSVYSRFNQDVRKGKEKYLRKTYTWYSLHFLLTEAIQILKRTQHECKYTFRGTDVTFDVREKEIRFGSFTSSSLDPNIAVQFGNESCFEIRTCYGADVTNYSVFPDETEILIPPYEKFIITDIKEDDWCKTVFVLTSSGIESNLNCVASVQSQIYQTCQTLLNCPHITGRGSIARGPQMLCRVLLSDQKGRRQLINNRTLFRLRNFIRRHCRSSLIFPKHFISEIKLLS